MSNHICIKTHTGINLMVASRDYGVGWKGQGVNETSQCILECFYFNLCKILLFKTKNRKLTVNRCLEAHTNVHEYASPFPNQRNVLAIVHRVKYRLPRVVSQYIRVSTTWALGNSWARLPEKSMCVFDLSVSLHGIFVFYSLLNKCQDLLSASLLWFLMRSVVIMMMVIS